MKPSMITALRPKTLSLLVAAAMLNLPLSALADPVCALGGVSQRSAITEICPFKDGLARVQTGYKWGFVDAAGKLAIAPQFDAVGDFSEGHAAAKRDEKWGLIDKQGKWVVEPAMEEIGPLTSGLASAQRGGKAGYIDATGKWIIPASYAYVGDFAGDVAVAHEAHDRAVLIERSGRVVKRFTPDMSVEQQPGKSGLFAASVQPAQRLLNVDGRKLPFPEGAANWAYKDQHFVATSMVARGTESVQLYGLVDLAGKWIIPATFGKLEQFDGKLAIASPADADGKSRFGLINRKGSFVVKPVYEKLTRQDDGGFTAVREGVKDKLEFLDAKGKALYALDCGDLAISQRVGVLLVLSGCQKTWLAHAQDGLIKTYAEQREVKVYGEHVLLMREGSQERDRALAFDIYNGAGKFVAASNPVHTTYAQGLDNAALLPPGPGARELPLAIWANYSGAVTLLMQDYKMVTRPDWVYDSVLLDYMITGDDAALEGPLVMKGRDGFGALDSKGNWAIQPKFSALSSFRNGVAFAKIDGKSVMVDRTGNTYDFPANAYRFERSGFMAVTGQSDAGVVTYDLKSGALNTLPQPAGRQSGKAVGGLIASEKGGKWGLANEKMAWVVAPAYDGEPTALMHDKKLVGWVTQNSYPTKSFNGHLHGLLDPEGRELIKPRYSALKLDDKSGLLIATEDDSLQSVLSTGGKTLVDPVLGSLTALGDGWFTAEMTSLHGLLDRRGEWVVKPGPFEFSQERPYAIRSKGPEPELMDAAGRISTRAAPLKLSAEEPSDWWWSDEKHVFYGFDFKERARIPGRPSRDGFSEGVIAFAPSDDKHSGKVGLADDKGKTIGFYDYAAIAPMVGGMAQVSKQVAVKAKGRQAEPTTRYGFIDRSGKLAVPLAFEHVADFSEKRATVIVGGALALIDASGKILLQGAWQCGRTAVLMDGNKKVVWPEEARKAGKCARVASLP
jgi:hypothetical protein